MPHPSPASSPPAARFLEQVLLASFVVHLVAIVTMAAICMNGVPDATAADGAARLAYVADHAVLWRIGWIPWHLSAAVDLLTGIAVVCTRWVPRLPAVLTLLVTLAAVGVEQSGEIPWTVQGPIRAAEARGAGEPQQYLDFEAPVYQRAVVWGASLYMVMALGWTWCFAAAETWSRALTWLSIVTWGALAVGSVALLLPRSWQPPREVVGAANGVGFLLLLLWLALVTERVLRRSRASEAHGRMAPWRHPWTGFAGRAVDAISNNRFLRGLCEWLPLVGLSSDITDVIYVNYLVEAERLTPLVPRWLELQRLGPGGRFALFSSLTYRHGHFGPGLFGPLRRLMPSPVQTNWRIYVRDPQTGLEGIYFVTNAIASTPHALGARMLSEGMPMHVLLRGAVVAEKGGSFTVALDPGGGTAPDLEGRLRPGPAELPAAWAECFASYRDFLAYCVPQDRALSSQPWYGRVTRQEIRLGIPLEECEPLQGEMRSRAAEGYVGNAAAVCFRVPRVAFRFRGEHYDYRRLAS
ncbi:MAG TPA: DUF2071 domain-containing protein [Gemmataceae bacterium]|nr:DUF2071 domain-containing protein [Gemmataceae bacterium]